jgi:hypothetical protein
MQATLLVSLLLVPLAADEKPAAETARIVTPFVNERTLVVGHADLTRLDLDAFFQWAREAKLASPEELANARSLLKELAKDFTSAGGTNIYSVQSLDDLPGPPLFIIPLDPKADHEAFKKALRRFGEREDIQFELRDRLLLGGDKAALARLRHHKPVNRPEVTEAFQALGPALARSVLFFPRDLRRSLEELLPTLPPELGGGQVTNLTRGVRWIAFAYDLPPKASIRVIVQTKNAETAREVSKIVKGALHLAAKEKELKKWLPPLEKLLLKLELRIEGDRLTLHLDAAEVNPLLVEVSKRVRGTVKQQEEAGNLKQIGLALWNYYDTRGKFPPAAFTDKRGKELLSWRVHLLPYLDQEKLYREFKLDEPWDSEHNKKLIPRMPAVFANPTNPKLARQGKTTFLAPLGDSTLFPKGKDIRIQDIGDGTSNTILLLDADDEHATIWTKPDDLRIDPKNPAKGLRIYLGKCFLFLMADGSTHLVDATISKETLWAAFTRDGGEPITLDE